MVQKEFSFKDISYLELWWPPCSAEQMCLGNFGRGHYEQHFCEIIMAWTSGLGGDVVKNISVIYSSGSHIVR